MVAPVTGPWTESITVVSPYYTGGPVLTYDVYGWRESSRQKKPFDIELPFEYGVTRITNQSVVTLPGHYGDAAGHQTPLLSSNFKQRVYAAMYERFVKKLKQETAELGSTLAQYEKARDMIVDRATRLRNGFRAIRRGNLYALKSQWGKGAGVRANAKKSGSNILEYSFGWAPLVKDIVSAVKILGDGIPPPKVRVRGRFGYSDDRTVNYGSTSRNFRTLGQLEVSLRARVRVTNPNALLLNELGLANPASVLWEIAPWSFVVDYFVNVQSFLGSFTDMLGIGLEGASHTFYSIENGSVLFFANQSGEVINSYTYERVDVTRTPGISGPSLVLKLPWRMSVQRATTSIALLLQQLKG